VGHLMSVLVTHDESESLLTASVCQQGGPFRHSAYPLVALPCCCACRWCNQLPGQVCSAPCQGSCAPSRCFNSSSAKSSSNSSSQAK
jgi:hypothetical protein